jgi:serine protease AprX
MAMNKKTFPLILVLSFLVSLSVRGQVKYWVKLKDKTGTPYTLSDYKSFLTEKSIARRTKYNIPYDNTDLPVSPVYISQISTVPNVTVLYASKWLNGVVVSIPNKTLAINALAAINSFSFVVDTTRVKRYHLNIPPVEEVDPKVEPAGARAEGALTGQFNYGGSLKQCEQLNLVCLHENGYRGQGMTIAVLDAGFVNADTGPVFDSLRNSGRILGTRHFVDGGTNVYVNSNHGTGVLSCMAANVPGNILGSAPLAGYWLLKTEEGPDETISEEYNWIRGAEFADSVGVDMLTTSLGYTDFDLPQQNHTYATLNGRTAPMSIAANIAARKGLFVLNAAGNEGASAWHYISVPGDADSICTVGAVDKNGTLGNFSSVGPTKDGRIKPDLVAVGVGTWISDGSLVTFPGNGTSFATPLLAGAVACFWQAHRSYNNIKILDTLRKLGTKAAQPDNFMGWGIPKLSCPPPCTLNANFTYNIESSGAVNFISTAVGASPGASYTWLFGDGSMASGASVIHSFANNANTAVLFIDNNTVQTCTDSSRVVAVGFNEPFDFTAHSNPDNSFITIYLAKAFYSSSSVEVIDMYGCTVLSVEQKSNDTQFAIDASALPNAYYVIRVKTTRGTKTKKIFKE